MAFPTTSVLDSGVGADADPIGGNWGNDPAGFNLQRVSNTISGSSGGTTNSGYWNPTTFNPTTTGVENFFTFNTVTADRVGLDFYTAATVGTATPDGYEVDTNRTSDLWRVKRITAGVGAAIGADVTQAVAVGDSCGMFVYKSGSDTIIEVYYKPSAGSWGLLFSRTDTGFTTFTVAGNIALYIAQNLPRVVNFGGGQAIVATVEMTGTFMMS